MLELYRAGLDADRAAGRCIGCPTLVAWSARNDMESPTCAGSRTATSKAWLQVVGSRLLAIGVLVDGAHRHLQLASERRQGRMRRPTQVVGHEAQVAQGAELEGEPEPVGRATPLLGVGQLLGGQGDVRGQVELADLLRASR